ncbi:ECF RNA polymerase sigma factor SigK [Frondihabitans sp. VKM Ac-2883]|uniref:ECF RNA polymerase sigma factor SigK n=1 Tax=Frondihabitans sp. VKM Ac-2883 TaxID=2783823 RepID=UPI00188D481B|nr:ECF RNA polymerase sigma factor SigK [Frondihabitans sp. VKM Ac-2883]
MSLAPAAATHVDRADEDLLLLVADGDSDAFVLLYDRTAPRVMGIIKRVLVDPAQSEEVTQDVFLEAWQQAARFDPRKGKALTWLLTMAHRRAIDRVRASQASRDRDLAVGIRDFEQIRDDVEETVETNMETRRIRRAMASLTPNQRHALEMTYFQGLTNNEAAIALGVPLGTMKTRLRDALIALRSQVATPYAA